MLSQRVNGPDHAGLRSAADDLTGGTAKAGFSRKASVDRAAHADVIVARAVARAKEGDSDAIRYLYLRYSDNVYSYVRTILHDDHEAEDVTQHVFAKLMTAIAKYEQRTAPFAGWILRLAHNAAIDHLRGGRRITPAEEIFGEDERGDEDVEREACLREALSTLPEEQRRVVVLRHVVGLTPPEIADGVLDLRGLDARLLPDRGVRPDERVLDGRMGADHDRPPDDARPHLRGRVDADPSFDAAVLRIRVQGPRVQLVEELPVHLEQRAGVTVEAAPPADPAHAHARAGAGEPPRHGRHVGVRVTRGDVVARAADEARPEDLRSRDRQARPGAGVAARPV
jgi:RNA polymerase sigma-70 factor (ECF subfamily)